MQPRGPAVSEEKVTDIRCPNCDLLLAKRDEIGQLVVRWKELCVMVVGGDTRVRCRRCGTECEV